MSQPAYIPHGAVDALMACRDAEVLVEGPAGTGKTLGGLQKLHIAALKYPGMRGLIVRQTRESMTESVLVTYESGVLPESSPLASGASRAGRAAYVYPNRSTLVIGGIKSSGRDNVAKIMSTQYDMIYMPEGTEASEENYEKLLSRLRNGVMPYQQIIVDCNPDRPSHWLNRRAAGGAMTRLLSRHEDNPRMYDQKSGAWTEQGTKYLAILGRLTGARKLRLKDGKWAQAEGLVYEAFDPAIHLVDRFDIPAEWRRIRVIDFGYTNPFVCQWWATDPDGRMFMYREIYRTRTLVEDHAAKIRELSEGERFEATVADHDAEDRATLERHGITTVAALKAVTPGIEAVQARIRKAGDKRPRLFMFNDSLVERDPLLDEAKKPASTAEEIDNYVWPKGTDGKSDKEHPVKVDDHGMDTMRYAVAKIDGLAPTVDVRVIDMTPKINQPDDSHLWHRSI